MLEYKNFIKFHTVGPSCSLRTDRQTDRWTDVTKRVTAFGCHFCDQLQKVAYLATYVCGKKRENLLLFQAIPSSTVSNTAQFAHFALFLSFSYFRLHAAKVVNYAVLEKTRRSLAEWSRMRSVPQEMRNCNTEHNTGLTNTKGLRHVQCPSVHIWILSISICI